MKVIICFGPIRVVVPCGAGELSIREVMDRAVHRYLKTLDNSSGVCVNIVNLKTIDNNALLDPGDRLKDVVDDKEQLVATFGLSSETSCCHRNGDGTSESSEGSRSPELIRDFGKEEARDFTRNRNLFVRRGSDEVLNFPAISTRFQHEKSSSVPVHMPGRTSSLGSSGRKANEAIVRTLNPPRHEEPEDGFPRKRPPHGDLYCTRIIPLKSPDPIPTNDCKSAVGRSEVPNGRHLRTESFDGFGLLHRSIDPSEDPNRHDEIALHLRDRVVSSKDVIGISASTSSSGKERFVIELRKGARGLGFSVTTQDNKTNEEESFIFVKKILPSGSAIEDGRLQPGDCILEVNGVQMTGKPQEEVVAFLRKIPVNENVVLVVARATKSLYLPSFNKSENLNSQNQSERGTDFNRNYSEETSAIENRRRRTKSDSRFQKDFHQDTDSVLSSESDSRGRRPHFTREGLGRQSMSEKRKGHLHPRTTETFEKIENHRSEKTRLQQCRADSVESLMDKCNTSELNWSSCEGIFGSFRTRAINDSFRAAIDKCFDADDFKNVSDTTHHKRDLKLNDEDKERQEKQKLSLKSFGKVKKPVEYSKKSEKSSKDQLIKSESKRSRCSPISWI